MRRLLACLAVLLVLGACRAEQAPVPQDRPVTPAPPAGGPLGLKWSWFQPDTLGFVAEAGGGWTFHEVEWCDLEPVPGAREWAGLDEIVHRALELGHQPMLKLRTGQCWGTLPPATGTLDPTEGVRKTPSTPPSDVGAYLAFVTDVVGRYAALGVHDWAVENEVDVANHWAGDLSSYDALVRQVAPAIRAADPGARILDAGISSTSYGVAVAASRARAGDEAGALAAYQEHYARRLAGGMSRWPAVTSEYELAAVLASAAAQRSVEALELTVRLLADGVVDAYQLHFYEPAAVLPGVLDLLEDRLGEEVRIEAWELGVAWPGTDYTESAHAAELLRLVALLLAHDVRRIVHLPVAYTPGERRQVFRGLVHEDGSTVVAGRLWLRLVDALDGLRDPPVGLAGGLTGVAWTADTGDAAVVWATDEAVALPAGTALTVLDASAREVDPTAPVGAGPVLVLGSPGGGLLDRLRDDG